MWIVRGVGVYCTLSVLELTFFEVYHGGGEC